MKKLGVSLIVILMFGCGEASTKHFPNVDVSILTQSFESWCGGLTTIKILI